MVQVIFADLLIQVQIVSLLQAVVAVVDMKISEVMVVVWSDKMEYLILPGRIQEVKVVHNLWEVRQV